ncbi:MAG TPA: MFS transporter [Anaerolineales bacterium]|jgi:GPH family glycoside/pentoside/hexuronide:cation symporter|nr:MFS transporter [Anaerolineales bacterium]
MYGVGDGGFSLTSTILGAYFAIFLTDVVRISPGIVAAAIFIGRSWDYVNDPLIGHISDRTRTRWGRRRPFLLFGAVPFALTFGLLWWRPPLENEIYLAIYYAAAYVVFDSAATFVYMPYFALTPELTPDYDERTALTTYRMFFSIFGSLIAFTVPLAIIGSFTPQNASRVLTMGLIFGGTSMALLLLTFLGTRERPEYSVMAQPCLSESIRAALKNRPFIFSIGIFLFTWVSVDILQTSLLFFIKYVVKREPQSDLIMATIFITAILALPLWEWASRHWNKNRAYILGISFWALVQIVLITLNPSTGIYLLLSLCILAGIGVGAAHVLPWSIIPDAIEWDEWQTGERHEGMFYSLVTLAQKVASSIAIPLALLLLEITGYIPDAAQQPDSALLGIRVLIGPIPAILLCAGILFAILYPLNRQQHKQIIAELERRRLQTQQTP